MQTTVSLLICVHPGNLLNKLVEILICRVELGEQSKSLRINVCIFKVPGSEEIQKLIITVVRRRKNPFKASRISPCKSQPIGQELQFIIGFCYSRGFAQDL